MFGSHLTILCYPKGKMDNLYMAVYAGNISECTWIVNISKVAKSAFFRNTDQLRITCNAKDAISWSPGKASDIVLAAAFIAIAPGIAKCWTGLTTNSSALTKQARTGSLKMDTCSISKKGIWEQVKNKNSINGPINNKERDHGLGKLAH
jgi:hypothetical protein